ncbi:hypothetical protein [Flavihumibacter sp. CACIAM 22H1]|uniref:hypothetical protein n=1 Tax=Flavihumibacter sp. CACIAM 22H1 TaxID=1812911 RepID=UPI0007A8A634|nr:hypothetical protein [Flavihumibacter sp. CACIAM 22H1]KYP14136.1 MAG: hypothetical protein A1D16_19995 [Flavihumibacter sp. CACIAM 22H1]
MSVFNGDQLMHATLAKLNEILTGGDEHAPANRNNFISWVTPGIPFGNADFDFLEKGFNAADATEMRKLIMQAADFALFADLVPDPSAIYQADQAQTIDRNSQERLSKIYGNILKFAKVTNLEPSEEEKKKLEKFKGLLYTTKKEKNLVTEEETERTVDSPISLAYAEKEQAYSDAVLLYNNKRISAAAGDNEEAVLDFSVNQPVYRSKVRSAMNAWTGAGYKNEVEAMHAYIAQVTGRSMASWFAELRDAYDRARFTESMIDFDFYPVRLFPANFHKQEWMKYSFSDKEVTTHASKSTTAWNASGGLNFGLWSAGAGASGSSERTANSMESNLFEMSFDLTQVKIMRPWFGTELFSCRGWKLDPGTWSFGSTVLSDGGNPPKGSFIAYSTHAVFARNLNLKFDKSAWQASTFKSKFDSEANLGWGPFRVKGGYSKGKETSDFHSKDTGEGISCSGMQLLCFINRLVGVCPDTDPNAKFD